MEQSKKHLFFISKMKIPLIWVAFNIDLSKFNILIGLCCIETLNVNPFFLNYQS